MCCLRGSISVSQITMEVVDGGYLCTTGYDSKRALFWVICKFCMCCYCVRLPCWVGVYEHDQCNVFLELAECCVGEYSEDIDAGYSLNVYVVCICFERHASFVCHSECGDRVGVGYGCVVECYCGLRVVSLGPGCD